MHDTRSVGKKKEEEEEKEKEKEKEKKAGKYNMSACFTCRHN